MTPRPRSARNRNLPHGLRDRDGYFSWRHPETGEEHGLGRNKAEAIAQAIEANYLLLGMMQRTRLVDKLTGAGDRTFGAWLDVYEKQLAKKELADNTRKTLRSQVKAARAHFGADVIDRINTRAVTGFLGGLVEEGKARTAQAMRSFLKDVFRAAVADGWIEINPVLVTKLEGVKVKRSRLTLDVYRQVHAAATPWLQNAMDLALVSCQGRDEIASARFADFHDNAWFCIRRKTKARIEIPDTLRMNALGLSLADVRTRCRQSGFLSKHLIHQTHAWGNSPVGSKIHIDRISKRFSETLAKLGIDFGKKNPPTFHEIRSLSARLYTEQGGVDVQALMGHKSPTMTQVYKDARGAEWVKVRIA